MVASKHSVPKRTFAQPGLSVLASCVVTLMLALFTHIVTCAPCYDDDVCASARIEGAFLQVLKAENLDFGKPADGGPSKIFVQTALKLASPVAVPPQAADIQTGRLLSENLPRNSALAHRRTVVLVI